MKSPVRRRMLAAIVCATVVVAALAGIVARTRPAGASPVALHPVALLDGGAYVNFYATGDGAGVTENFSSPAVGDVLGNGQQQVVVGGMDGCVRVFATSGTQIVGCLYTGPGAVQASPLLYDFDHDGRLDVLAANATTGDVYVFHGGDWRVMFHTVTGPWNGLHGVFGTPAVGDIDHDGQPEIVATSLDNHVYAWKMNGALVPGFPQWVYDTILSSPVIADIDHDGWPEIVFGADMDAYPGAPYPAGGLVWVFRHDGAREPGWPRSLPGQTIWSTPAVVDLNNDGNLDIVVGTGLNFPNAGHLVWALDRFGRDLPNWPMGVDGAVMASPSIGTWGTTKIVAVAAEGGWVYALRSDGYRMWRQCVEPGGACGPGVATHGSVTVADVNGDGVPDVVTALDKFVVVYNLLTGAEEARIQTTFDGTTLQPVVGGGNWAPANAPTVASVNGEARIFVSTIFNTNPANARGPGDTLAVYEFGTGTPLGSSTWPTFKADDCRSGMLTGCDQQPPSAPTLTVGSSPTTTQTTVTWHSTDNASGVSSFIVDVADNGRWARWLTNVPPTGGVPLSATGSSVLYGLAGHTYTIRAWAFDAAGNLSGSSSWASVTFPANATHAVPYTAAYTVAANGAVGGVGSAPLTAGTWGPSIGRGIAVLPSGAGGYTLDGWGGVHPFGNAPSVAASAYWPGWDVARGIAVNSDGSGYVLDAFGALHPFGGAAVVRNTPYWPRADIARGVVLLPSSDAGHPAGYVLDVLGGVHPFGTAPPVAISAYWPTWPIARGIAIDPTSSAANPGGYVLDGWGGVHRFGSAPDARPSAFWAGWDIARGVTLLGAGKGYTVDGLGGVHPFGTGVPSVPTTAYWGRDIARGIALAP